jgi:hypothetical protein
MIFKGNSIKEQNIFVIIIRTNFNFDKKNIIIFLLIINV